MMRLKRHKITQKHDKQTQISQKQVKRRTVLIGAGSAFALSACGPMGATIPGLPVQGQTPATQPIAPQGERIGQGRSRVALLLPLSATGNAGGSVATSFKNAAELALAALGQNDLELIIKDTLGTPQGASAAASQAVSEGAQLILGPIFSAEVNAVAQIARTANLPVIAFSSDASAARRNINLLSFLPASDARRIVFFARSQGKSSIAALIPNTGYGQVMEASMRQAASEAGMQVALIERYDPDRIQMQAATMRLAGAQGQFDSLFIPQSGNAMLTIAKNLNASGITPQNTLWLGTGQWEDASIYQNAALRGAVYPAPKREGFQDFSNRYAARYGSQPLRVASLSYDAVTLAAALARQGNGHIDTSLLTMPSGFTGIDGIFRFLSDGTNQRGLALYQMTGSGTTIAEPAPNSFQQGRF